MNKNSRNIFLTRFKSKVLVSPRTGHDLLFDIQTILVNNDNLNVPKHLAITVVFCIHL